MPRYEDDESAGVSVTEPAAESIASVSSIAVSVSVTPEPAASSVFSPEVSETSSSTVSTAVCSVPDIIRGITVTAAAITRTSKTTAIMSLYKAMPATVFPATEAEAAAVFDVADAAFAVVVTALEEACEDAVLAVADAACFISEAAIGFIGTCSASFTNSLVRNGAPIA